MSALQFNSGSRKRANSSPKRRGLPLVLSLYKGYVLPSCSLTGLLPFVVSKRVQLASGVWVITRTVSMCLYRNF